MHTRMDDPTQAFRLLLLELVNPDPVHPWCADVFPYLQGLDGHLGLTVRWERHAVEAPPWEFEPRLDEAIRGAILRRVQDFTPTHLLANVGLDPALTASLRALDPRLHLRSMESTHSVLRPDAFWGHLAWLGIEEAFRAKHPSVSIAPDAIAPSYAATDHAPSPEGAPEIFEIHTGTACVYAAPIHANPFFKELKDPAVRAIGGCSFCPSRPWVQPFHRRPIDLALDHMRAAERDRPRRNGEERQYIFSSGQLFVQLKVFGEALLSLDLPPSTFLFSARIDELLDREDTIHALLPRFADRGHRLGIQRIGVENFSEVENARFNKGVTPDQIDRAFRAVRRLEETWPEHFLFRQLGGFGFILFTPWTTLDDLEVNLRKAREHEIDAWGFFLQSRLQLLPGRAITALAEHEGLTVDAAQDHAFFSGCIQFGDVHERPWRFRDPTVACVAAVARRLIPDPACPPGDPLAASVADLLLDVPIEDLEAPRLFELLLAAARRLHEPTVEALLAETRRAIERARARLGSPGPPPGSLTGRELSSLIASVRPDLLGGMVLRSMEVALPTLILRLHSPDQSLEIRLSRRTPGARAFVHTARYAVSFAGTPAHAERAHGRVVSVLARALDRHATGSPRVAPSTSRRP